jgi:hypothetical protein
MHRSDEKFPQWTISQRGTGPDDENEQSSRQFLGRVYSTAAIDPEIEEELDAFACRESMNAGRPFAPIPGGANTACNCAPGGCACSSWARRRYAKSERVAASECGPRSGCVPRSDCDAYDELGVNVGAIEGEDWGIPTEYAEPSAPIQWLTPPCEDYYGPEGATVHMEDMYLLTEPDHELLH